MDLLYNRMKLYNRIKVYSRRISPLILLIFTGVTFSIFWYLIYFRLVLKAVNNGRFLWWMYRKNKMQTKAFSLKFLLSKFYPNSLTLSWRRPISYRNQSIDLLHKSMDWFLYDIGLRLERVKLCTCRKT